jgi:Fe-Mn family superoxide dismutase
MKVSIKYENPDLKKHKNLVNEFIKLLQEEYPLKKDLKILFVDGRKGDMSTGSRRGDNLIKVLAKGRLNRDIMRTLAHEWVHEYQMTILGREPGPNIGGRNEDEANAFAGQLVKKFEEKHPDLEKLMYENKGIEGRVSILSEQILLTEKETIKENLLVEMKKVGIEKLPYSYSALQRFIDSKTMNVHYNKHYKGYVDKLNKAIKDKEGDMDLEEIVKSISKFDDKVRNNAGGAFNHALFWKMLSPKKQLPKGEILKKIKEDFGNIKKMKDEFNQAAQDRFGSGWAWLYLAKDGKLKIMSTPNQDNPLMNIVKGGGYPLLGLDVWEHAYYLKYQNKRDEYIKKFWDVVNWEFVGELYNSKTKKQNLKESLDDDRVITESKARFPLYGKQLMDLIFSTYPSCNGSNFEDGCVGKLDTDFCKTGQGIIGGDYTESNFGLTISTWSLINRFDTNSRVHSKIVELYESDENKDPKQSLISWVQENKNDLFGNNGKYTETLADIVSETVERGYAAEILANQFLVNALGLDYSDMGKTWSILERCGGDYRDRDYGQDFEIRIGSDVIYVQTKPVITKNIKKYESDRGEYYLIPSWNAKEKYKPKYVDLLVYVDVDNKKYIVFRNDHSKIQTVANSGHRPGTPIPPYSLYFYEEPFSTNMDIKLSKRRSPVPVKQRLEKSNEQKKMEYLAKIKYYQDLISKLGESPELTESLKKYQKRLQQIITK